MKLDFDPSIMHPARLLIISKLIQVGKAKASFVELQKLLNTSAGNLHSHLLVLKKRKFIKEHKEFVGVIPRTSYTVTLSGIENVNQMKAFIREWLGD